MSIICSTMLYLKWWWWAWVWLVLFWKAGCQGSYTIRNIDPFFCCNYISTTARLPLVRIQRDSIYRLIAESWDWSGSGFNMRWVRGPSYVVTRQSWLHFTMLSSHHSLVSSWTAWGERWSLTHWHRPWRGLKQTTPSCGLNTVSQSVIRPHHSIKENQICWFCQEEYS